MSTKSVKYPSKLGKPITNRESEAAALKVALAASGRGLKAIEAELTAWQDRYEFELLLALIDHYKIPQDHKHKWFRLARELAHAHVPAFKTSRRVGRPRKFKKGQTQAQFLFGVPSAKPKPGRKTEITDGMYRSLAKKVRKICEAEGFTGRGAITNALVKWICDDAHTQNISPLKAIRKNLKYFQKRYSDAIEKFPELALKFRK